MKKKSSSLKKVALAAVMLLAVAVPAFASRRETSPKRNIRISHVDWARRIVHFTVTFLNIPGEKDQVKAFQVGNSSQNEFIDFDNHTVMTYTNPSLSIIGIDLFDADGSLPIQRVAVDFHTRKVQDTSKKQINEKN